MNTIFSLPMDIYKNRRLVAKLAKNDFKTRYAGSYLGIVWAFIQPVITILVYWFVFSVGFRSGTGDLGVPFVLYLVAGIVPWFFFQDALMGGTNSLLEYNYLVKKVVFNISVLPVVKIISAMFVHAFFVLFTIILYAAYVIKFPACKSRSVKINHLFSFPSHIPVSYFCRQLLFPPDPGYSSH